MKLKLTSILIICLFASVSASPNRYHYTASECNKLPGMPAVKQIDDSRLTIDDNESDLIPTKYFFNHI